MNASASLAEKCIEGVVSTAYWAVLTRPDLRLWRILGCEMCIPLDLGQCTVEPPGFRAIYPLL